MNEFQLIVPSKYAGTTILVHDLFGTRQNSNCEAQARVRQGSARDGSRGERPQSLNHFIR